MSRGIGPVARIALVVVSVLLGSCSDVVRLPDCVDCRPVEMAIAQKLEVELGSDRAVTNDPDAFTWVVVDTGTMALVAEDRGTRSEDENEFIGGYSRYVIYTFEPTRTGETQMEFEFVPRDGSDVESASTLDITVVVSE